MGHGISSWNKVGGKTLDSHTFEIKGISEKILDRNIELIREIFNSTFDENIVEGFPKKYLISRKKYMDSKDFSLIKTAIS